MMLLYQLMNEFGLLDCKTMLMTMEEEEVGVLCSLIHDFIVMTYTD